MAEKNIFTQRRKTEQQAEKWFDSTDDQLPFVAFSNPQEQLHIGEEMLSVIRQKMSRSKRLVLWYRVAAAVLLLISAGIISYQAYQTSKPGTTEQTWLSYAAGKGEFKQITLPDHSVIHLRPGAKVSVAKPFIQNVREVKLQQGEVYFEVSHDPAHPFLVNSGQMTTEVLGTKFIINNDPLEANISVALLSGKVAVRTEKVQLGVLVPHQKLFYHKLNGTAKVVNNVAQSAEDWLKGEYILEDVPLKSFASAFGNAFGLAIKFEQKTLEDLPISIQFNLKDHPKSILEQLKLIHGINYEIKDKEVTLRR